MQKKNKDFTKIAILFATLAVAFSLVLSLAIEAGYLKFFISFTTYASAYLMELFGIKAPISGDKILLASRTFIITAECASIFIIGLYASLVIAYPTDIRRKITGLAVGIPVIVVANLIRLLVLAIVSEKAPAYFNYTHDYLWQIVFIFITSGLWLLWIGKGDNDEAKASVHS